MAFHFIPSGTEWMISPQSFHGSADAGSSVERVMWQMTEVWSPEAEGEQNMCHRPL